MTCHVTSFIPAQRAKLANRRATFQEQTAIFSTHYGHLSMAEKARNSTAAITALLKVTAGYFIRLLPLFVFVCNVVIIHYVGNVRSAPSDLWTLI